MKVLLDTSVFLWIISDDGKLSPEARAVYLAEGTDPLLSVASVWEIMIKASLGKLDLPARAGQFIKEQLRLTSCTLLDITVDHCVMVRSLPFHHKDPFDRLIAAQALVERIPVLSSDRTMTEYGVKNLF
jgi:PIN domain nuclease of toxin-antitoxin system